MNNEGTIFNLNIGDYDSTVKSIKKIDSLILISKNLLIEYAKNKAEDKETKQKYWGCVSGNREAFYQN